MSEQARAAGPMEHLKEPEYLGDGVHVGYDGLHVVVWLENPGAYGFGVGMGPGVLRAFDRYVERVCGEGGRP